MSIVLMPGNVSSCAFAPPSLRERTYTYPRQPWSNINAVRMCWVTSSSSRKPCYHPLITIQDSDRTIKLCLERRQWNETDRETPRKTWTTMLFTLNTLTSGRRLVNIFLFLLLIAWTVFPTVVYCIPGQRAIFISWILFLFLGFLRIGLEYTVCAIYKNLYCSKLIFCNNMRIFIP